MGNGLDGHTCHGAKLSLKGWQQRHHHIHLEILTIPATKARNLNIIFFTTKAYTDSGNTLKKYLKKDIKQVVPNSIIIIIIIIIVVVVAATRQVLHRQASTSPHL